MHSHSSKKADSSEEKAGRPMEKLESAGDKSGSGSGVRPKKLESEGKKSANHKKSDGEVKVVRPYIKKSDGGGNKEKLPSSTKKASSSGDKDKSSHQSKKSCQDGDKEKTPRQSKKSEPESPRPDSADRFKVPETEEKGVKVEDVPAFFPTDEEFQDPLKYVSQIQRQAERYGMARIVPPRSFRVGLN